MTARLSTKLPIDPSALTADDRLLLAITTAIGELAADKPALKQTMLYAVLDWARERGFVA